MADLTDYCSAVLSRILQETDQHEANVLLDKAQLRLAPEHFLDAQLRFMFQVMCRLQESNGAILSRPILEGIIRSQDAGKQALYLETFDSLLVRDLKGYDFGWSIEQILDITGERKWGEALAQSMEILRTGATDRKGVTVKGWQESKDHMLERIEEIERQTNSQDAPGGDMRLEQNEMIADYQAQKAARASGRGAGIGFGIKELDDKIGGFQPGELNLLAGYSSDGKTSLCVQLAWSAAIEQGKNVVIFTTETLRAQVRRKILARHSRLPVFELPEGLNSRWLKDGTIPEPFETKQLEVVQDLATNPKYGRLYVQQVPRGATLDTVERLAYSINRRFHIEMAIVDYLRLLRSSVKRSSDREELGAIIVEAKQWATTFDNGRGIPVFSPWQVNRQARDAAERAGYYTSQALAETAEATNTADVICSLLAPADNEDRYCEVRAQILKNRDGEKSNSIPLKVDYATNMFTGLNRSSGLEPEALASDSVGGEMDFLLDV